MAKKADKGARIGNFLMDLFIILILYFIIIFILILAFPNDLEKYIDSFGLLFLVLYLVYYIILEAFWCKTVGKMLTKTYVVDKNNKKPSVWKIIIRTVLRFFPLGPIIFLFGFTCIHDILSGTKVIKN